MFRTYFGPTKVAFGRLDPVKQKALYDDLLLLWKEHNQAADERTVVQGEYLDVRVRPN